jgi:D-threo-aldose 1-dehydrogenase
MEQLTTGGGFRALERLRSEGTIGAFGIGVNEIEVCHEVLELADIDVILLAGRYTLLEQPALGELFPLCERLGVGVVVGGPYNSGILASGISSGARLHYNYAPPPPSIIERVTQIQQVCRRHEVPLKAAAIQFVLGHPVVTSVIPGVASALQVRDTLQMYRLPIPADLWSELKAEGLLAHEAPVPLGVPR